MKKTTLLLITILFIFGCSEPTGTTETVKKLIPTPVPQPIEDAVKFIYERDGKIYTDTGKILFENDNLAFNDNNISCGNILYSLNSNCETVSSKFLQI